MSALAAILLIILIFLGVPVAHSLIFASGVAMSVNEPLFLYEAILNLYKPTASFPMLAIPFFILAGDLMMSGRFGEFLINFSKILVGRLKGGLAQVSVVGSLFFGGISGSAVADASALGNALIPVQKKQGYPPGFSAAVNAASSTISVLIPPSIPLILFGLVTETSIPKLFLAGIVPGITLMVLIFMVCYAIARIRNLPTSPLAAGDKQFNLMYIYKAIPAILMPIMVIVLARGGVVTPTEISVFAVAYALIVSIFIYRDMSFPIFFRSVLTSGIMTGAIMLIIMASSVLQWILSYENVPENIAIFIVQAIQSPWMIIIAMNLVMIMIGTFLDLPAAILLLAPIFLGVASEIGMDTIQLGVLMVTNLAIGLYTPPVGTTLFVSVAIERVPIGQVVKHLLPFYIVALLMLIVVSFVPQFTQIFL